MLGGFPSCWSTPFGFHTLAMPFVSQEAGKRVVFCDSGSAQSRPLLGGNLSPRQTPILWTVPTKSDCIGLYFVRPYYNCTCTGSTIVFFFISISVPIVLSWDWELWIPQTQVDAGKAFKSSCVEKESARRIARWEVPKAVKGKSEHASVASSPKTEELCATFGMWCMEVCSQDKTVCTIYILYIYYIYTCQNVNAPQQSYSNP